MRTLVRYSWPATWSIYFGTLVVMGFVLGTPHAWRKVVGTFALLWFGACALYCVAIWLSAALTPEGRSSATPWASGLAVAVKVVGVAMLFGDNLRYLFSTPVEGRPLRAGRTTHRTEAVPGGAWSHADEPSPLSPEPELAGVDWLELAGDEHASVAAFSRLSLELLAAGAPPQLVAGAHRAALEEVEHAQLCFRVASLLSGERYTAAPLPPAVAPLELPASGQAHLARLALESFRDGWLNEGAAARGIERMAASARTPWLREALMLVARQERSHAELGARIAQWCTRAATSAGASASPSA